MKHTFFYIHECWGWGRRWQISPTVFREVGWACAPPYSCVRWNTPLPSNETPETVSLRTQLHPLGGGRGSKKGLPTTDVHFIPVALAPLFCPRGYHPTQYGGGGGSTDIVSCQEVAGRKGSPQSCFAPGANLCARCGGYLLCTQWGGVGK